MKLSYFGILITVMGCLFIVSIMTWLVLSALSIDNIDYKSLPYIAISGTLFLVFAGLGVAFNLSAYTTKKIHVTKFICQEECESAFYLDCDIKHCLHARPHSRTLECDRIGCERILSKRLT